MHHSLLPYMVSYMFVSHFTSGDHYRDLFGEYAGWAQSVRYISFHLVVSFAATVRARNVTHNVTLPPSTRAV